MPHNGYSDQELNNMIRPVRKLDPDMREICHPKLNRAFNGAAWSAYSKIQDNTNCYCYALGFPDMGSAQPGDLIYSDEFYVDAGEGFSCFTEQDVRDRVERDGLIMISEQEALSGNVHAIAMTVASDDDFHFFLRDADGTWSDKMGRHAVKQNLGIIVPSKQAVNNRYRNFGGYFKIPAQGIEYTPRLSVPSPVMNLF